MIIVNFADIDQKKEQIQPSRTSLSIRTNFASLATLSLSPVEKDNAAGDDVTQRREDLTV